MVSTLVSQCTSDAHLCLEPCSHRLGTAVVFSAIYYKALSRRSSTVKSAAAKAGSTAGDAITDKVAAAGSVSAADLDRVALVSASRTSSKGLRESA